MKIENGQKRLMGINCAAVNRLSFSEANFSLQRIRRHLEENECVNANCPHNTPFFHSKYNTLIFFVHFQLFHRISAEWYVGPMVLFCNLMIRNIVRFDPSLNHQVDAVTGDAGEAFQLSAKTNIRNISDQM